LKKSFPVQNKNHQSRLTRGECQKKGETKPLGVKEVSKQYHHLSGWENDKRMKRASIPVSRNLGGKDRKHFTFS